MVAPGMGNGFGLGSGLLLRLLGGNLGLGDGSSANTSALVLTR